MRDTKPEGRGGEKWLVGAWVRYFKSLWGWELSLGVDAKIPSR